MSVFIVNSIIITAYSEFDESMDALQREMKEIEGENLELKQRANKMSKETLYKNIQFMEHATHGRSAASTNGAVSAVGEEGGASRGEVVFLEQQLSKQMDARKRAELEVRKLTGELAQSGSKRFPAVPGLISGPITLESQSRQDMLLKLIDNLHDESLRLRREEVNHQAYVPSNPNISIDRMIKEMENFNRKREQFYDKLNSVRFIYHCTHNFAISRLIVVFAVSGSMLGERSIRSTSRQRPVLPPSPSRRSSRRSVPSGALSGSTRTTTRFYLLSFSQRRVREPSL